MEWGLYGIRFVSIASLRDRLESTHIEEPWAKVSAAEREPSVISCVGGMWKVVVCLVLKLAPKWFTVTLMGSGWLHKNQRFKKPKLPPHN